LKTLRPCGHAFIAGTLAAQTQPQTSPKTEILVQLRKPRNPTRAALLLVAKSAIDEPYPDLVPPGMAFNCYETKSWINLAGVGTGNCANHYEAMSRAVANLFIRHVQQSACAPRKPSKGKPPSCNA